MTRAGTRAYWPRNSEKKAHDDALAIKCRHGRDAHIHCCTSYLFAPTAAGRARKRGRPQGGREAVPARRQDMGVHQRLAGDVMIVTSEPGFLPGAVSRCPA